MEIQTVDIDQLTADPANVRVHGPRNNQAIKSSLERFGAARSIVVDGDGVVRAGNGTLAQAKAAGISQAVIVECDGKQLVAVRRKDWSPQDGDAYALADNRTGELAEWDFEGVAAKLKSLDEAGMDISDLGWAEHELDPLLAAEWKPPAVDDSGDTGSKTSVTFTPDQWQHVQGAMDAYRQRHDQPAASTGDVIACICKEWAEA